MLSALMVAYLESCLPTPVFTMMLSHPDWEAPRMSEPSLSPTITIFSMGPPATPSSCLLANSKTETSGLPQIYILSSCSQKDLQTALRASMKGFMRMRGRLWLCETWERSLKAAITGMWFLTQEQVRDLLTVPSSVLSRSRTIWKHSSHWVGTVRIRMHPTRNVCLSSSPTPSLPFISSTLLALSCAGGGRDRGTVSGKTVAYSSTVMYLLRKGRGRTPASLLCLPTTRTVRSLNSSSFDLMGVQLRITCSFWMGLESPNAPFSSSALNSSERLILLVSNRQGMPLWVSFSNASLAPAITRSLMTRVPSMSIANPTL